MGDPIIILICLASTKLSSLKPQKKSPTPPASSLLPSLLQLPLCFQLWFSSPFLLLCLLSCFPSISLHLSRNRPSPEKSSSSFLSKTQNITPLLQQHSLTVPLQKPPTILCLPLLSEIFLLPKTPKNPPPRSVSPSYCPTIPLSLTASLSPKLPQSADMLPL